MKQRLSHLLCDHIQVHWRTSGLVTSVGAFGTQLMMYGQVLSQRTSHSVSRRSSAPFETLKSRFGNCFLTAEADHTFVLPQRPSETSKSIQINSVTRCTHSLDTPSIPQPESHSHPTSHSAVDPTGIAARRRSRPHHARSTRDRAASHSTSPIAHTHRPARSSPLPP